MPQKSKHSRKISQRWVLMILLIPLVCYAPIWIFARFGGEWATARDIPVPENSIVITTTNYDSLPGSIYTYQDRLFAIEQPVEWVREWYSQANITLIGSDDNEFLSEDYYSVRKGLFYRDSPMRQLHIEASLYFTSWFDDVRNNCQGVKVYRTVSGVLADYPDIDLTPGVTYFQIENCWPNVKW